VDDGGVLIGAEHEACQLVPTGLLPTGDARPYGSITNIHNE